MSTTHCNSPAVLQARITELTAKGYSLRAAERVAKRERKASHPLHKRAIARRIAIADTAFAATGKVVAL